MKKNNHIFSLNLSGFINWDDLSWQPQYWMNKVTAFISIYSNKWILLFEQLNNDDNNLMPTFKNKKLHSTSQHRITFTSYLSTICNEPFFFITNYAYVWLFFSLPSFTLFHICYFHFLILVRFVCQIKWRIAAARFSSLCKPGESSCLHADNYEEE